MKYAIGATIGAVLLHQHLGPVTLRLIEGPDRSEGLEPAKCPAMNSKQLTDGERSKVRHCLVEIVGYHLRALSSSRATDSTMARAGALSISLAILLLLGGCSGTTASESSAEHEPSFFEEPMAEEGASGAAAVSEGARFRKQSNTEKVGYDRGIIFGTDTVYFSEGLWKIEGLIQNNISGSFGGARYVVELVGESGFRKRLINSEASAEMEWGPRLFLVGDDPSADIPSGLYWFEVNADSDAHWFVGANPEQSSPAPTTEPVVVGGHGSDLSDGVYLHEGVWRITVSVKNNHVTVGDIGFVNHPKPFGLDAVADYQQGRFQRRMDLVSDEVVSGIWTSELIIDDDLSEAIPSGDVWFSVLAGDQASWTVTIHPS